MPIDVPTVLSAEPAIREVSWTTRDVLLYHLSLGASRTGDIRDLTWTYERGLRVLPSFAIVAGRGISTADVRPPSLDQPGLDIDMHRVLHGGQRLTVHDDIPTSGSARLASRIANVWDKGKAAVLEMEQHATGTDGTDLWTATMLIWIRGEGGFGGDPGPSDTWIRPDREPDAVVDTQTGPETALLYRLNADLNPLHVDPEFASTAGFDRPILHGLASYGIACRALADEVVDPEVSRLARLDVRFAGPMWPGDTLRTSLWVDDAEVRLVATCPDRGDEPVLTHGRAAVVGRDDS